MNILKEYDKMFGINFIDFLTNFKNKKLSQNELVSKISYSLSLMIYDINFNLKITANIMEFILAVKNFMGYNNIVCINDVSQDCEISKNSIVIFVIPRNARPGDRLYDLTMQHICGRYSHDNIVYITAIEYEPSVPFGFLRSNIFDYKFNLSELEEARNLNM